MGGIAIIAPDKIAAFSARECVTVSVTCGRSTPEHGRAAVRLRLRFDPRRGTPCSLPLRLQGHGRQYWNIQSRRLVNDGTIVFIS